MASETTFDHWKVVFLMRKSEKGPNFLSPLLPILRLTFLESSCNLRKFGMNKKYGYFFRLDGSSGLMWGDMIVKEIELIKFEINVHCTKSV